MSARRSTGVMLIASGSVLMFIGFMLSISLAGAICGIPLIIVSAIMVIWGYLMKAKDRAIKDEMFAERMLQTQAIASGVNICSRCKTPNARSSSKCSNCGLEFLPIRDPQLISAVDPTESAFFAKQIKSDNIVLFEPED